MPFQQVFGMLDDASGQSDHQIVALHVAVNQQPNSARRTRSDGALPYASPGAGNYLHLCHLRYYDGVTGARRSNGPYPCRALFRHVALDECAAIEKIGGHGPLPRSSRIASETGGVPLKAASISATRAASSSSGSGSAAVGTSKSASSMRACSSGERIARSTSCPSASASG